jgi:hypothetical protein
MSDLGKQDWQDWLQHPVTRAYLAHIEHEWGPGGRRFEGIVEKFSDSLEEDRIVLDKIRQVAVCRREILKLKEWPREEIERLRNMEPVEAGFSRRGGL